MPQQLYVGLDAGGSGTRAALANANGELLAIGFGGPSGHLGDAAGLRRLRRALADALAPLEAHPSQRRPPDSAAHPESRTPVRIHAGLRGLSIPARHATALDELARHFASAQLSVSNDALIAQWAGLGGQPGVAVLAGTGSIALARDADGREARAGGYGYLISDEGSAFWLGRAALSACLRVRDGRGPPTSLAQRITHQTRQSSINDVVGWLYSGSSQVQRVARLAPLVSSAAHEGDAVATDLLDEAGHHLARIAAAAARQLWPTPTSPPDPLDVARCGGVWAAGPLLREPFARALRALLPTANPIEPRLPPVGGALLLAMGAHASASALASLERSFASQRSTTSPVPVRTRRRRP